MEKNRSGADLHVHSTFSDGKGTPEEIVKKAKSLGLTTLALTDHNTFDGIRDFLAACEAEGIHGIAGSEISTLYKGQEVHLLGFFKTCPNPQEQKELFDYLETYKHAKTRQNEAMLEKLIKAGYPVSLSEFYNYAKTLSENGNFNRVHIGKYLAHKGITKTYEEAFDTLIGDDCPYYVEKQVISLPDAIDLVKRSGGDPFIAHLGLYDLDGEEREVLDRTVVAPSGCSYELFHPDNDEETRTFIRAHLGGKPYSLGSDDHGKNEYERLGKVFCDPVDLMDINLIDEAENRWRQY